MAWGRASSGSSVFIARKHMQSDVGRKGRTGCESRTQKQRDKQLARQAAAQILFVGYGLPQLERKFQSSNGHDPVGDPTQSRA